MMVKCICGNDLVLRMQPAFEVAIKPLKNGRYPKLKKKDIIISQLISDSHPEWLECNECHREYDFMLDKGVVVELWEK
ncbi:hypothetical protein NDS46_31505 (plasmid) [Paenibacillus thiaminolyticus]|uniref:hypothetical protein n=1 Tax=Paenibacillus thiaminolyticus TaxID=49283 RepID=UPI00232C5D39|nr:hypothetical protein [Paenibacillus thiaminolyticus]WCF11485.1 hypothetical protein NDS46_31505 [Paenibacillus thiaminolyticus]